MMRTNVRFTASFLLMIIILAIVYGVVSQFQVPEWVLQFTFYAFMTAMFGFIFGVLLLLVRDHFNARNLKRTRKLESLDALKGEYSQCKWIIERTIKSIEKNAITETIPELATTIDMGELRFSERLKQEVQKYGDEVGDYNIFRKTSDAQIRNSIHAKIRRMFPKSLEKHDELSTMFCSDLLMTRYFDGEGITESWFKETEPIMFKNIVKEIDLSERHELDVLFNEMNNDFKKEDILLRYRKQKELVIQEGKKLIEDLAREISSIDKQLQKYDYLRVTEQESEDSFMNNY